MPADETRAMRGLFKVFFILASSTVALATAAGNADSICLPVVDLGYERHQAISYTPASGVYKFQNIRYAQPPVGDLRFRAPQAPKNNRTGIVTGSETRMCPQGVPAWQADAYIPIAKYSNPNVTFSLQSWEKDILQGQAPPGDPNTGADEDCLFLDVHVTKKTLGQAKTKNHGGAPVIVWIHGGGYVLGSKQGTPTPGYDPIGLFEHASKTSDDGLVFVALNYRLGALGFLSGTEIQQNGNLNAGLLDQRFALQWVQDNIHLFGGSRDRVTVMGESAGGGAILLHLASYSQTGRAPFAQAIPQSPAMIPSAMEPKNTFQEFLSYLKVSTLEEARRVNTSTIIAANAAHIGAAPTTNYIFGPVVDGHIITRPPLEVAREAKYDPSIKIMVGHNMFEGAFFFDPKVSTNDQFRAWVSRSIVGLQSEQVNYLVDHLYPQNFDVSLGYVDLDSRQMKLWSEAVIDCNFYFTTLAKSGHNYAYEFGVPPGFHIEDLKYTFNDPKSPAAFPIAQDALQQAIVTFVQSGVPKTTNNAPFPQAGAHGALVNITSTGTELATSKVNGTRCDWWANAIRY